MVLAFRPRNYTSEILSHSLPFARADTHPLSSPSPLHQQQDDVVEFRENEFFDPLRDTTAASSAENVQDIPISAQAATMVAGNEWVSFKRGLMQRFLVTKTVSISSVSTAVLKSSKSSEKSSAVSGPGKLDDPQNSGEGANIITRQEYLSRIHELKDEITRAWRSGDRVTSLKVSIKVARLLMDTSISQFYPTVFVAVTDVLDMTGDMVWERIKQKAEFADDGTAICRLAESFEACDIRVDAKETCYNWFCKLGSIRELLPRIYLELAILPCWRFLFDQPIDSLNRLVMMTRGIADPLASAYCRLYLVHRAQKFPSCTPGYLITCVDDIKMLLMRSLSENESLGHVGDDKRLLVSLIEPAVEYVMKCIFADESQVGDVLGELGIGRNQLEIMQDFQCVSIVTHHLLKELPAIIVSSHFMEILHLIKCSNDDSFSQFLNYRLLGFRLSEVRSQVGIGSAVVDEVLQVVSQYDRLDEYVKVVDAYMDIILENKDKHLCTVLECISKLACDHEVDENELASLQHVLVKILMHFKDLKDVFALNHFLKILDMMYGNSGQVVNMHILTLAGRNGCVRDPSTIQLLFEICQALHDSIDFASMKDDDNQQSARLISRFVQLVDYGEGLEQHLHFLVECRGTFGSVNELKEILVHSSNTLATKAMKDGNKHTSFVKSCIAFSEVTIPSISAQLRQLNLYLETAEVALLCGLVSHSDTLIDSAVDCLQSATLMDGPRSPTDTDGLLSLIGKLCSLLVMVPGNPEKGILYIPKIILFMVHSKPWMTSRMKTKIFCSVISLSATLSQDKLPYHASHPEIVGNDFLFFGDSSYVQELLSATELVLQKLVDVVNLETSLVARGIIALEACNCIASAFTMNDQASSICARLIEIAQQCLNANNKYLQSTVTYLDKCLPASTVALASVSV